ncbi:MAG: ABC transporter permease, partial [Proteobacteria bacterium]
FLPIVLLPVIFLSVGFSWFLSSLGTFLRDIPQFVSVFTTVLMFMTPIFYPISALPQNLQAWLSLNPISLVIEQIRDVTIWGRYPAMNSVALALIGSIVFAWLGFAWFQRTRRGFADVL